MKEVLNEVCSKINGLVIVLLTLTSLISVAITAQDIIVPSASHSTEASADRMRVRDGYEVRLVAAEPDVVDPISAAWGINGKLWVVEMSDYPLPKPGQTQRNGRIRLLSDRDSNGRFGSSTIFADGLDFATGVLPWRDGAIVTVAGQIIFLRDQDGDGKADQTEVWFEGFTIENEQLRANHPTLGPDGLVYIAGGLRGGSIVAVDPQFDPKTKPVSLNGRDFVFDPDGGYWSTVSGNSQHGLTIDDFNRRLGCSNRNPAIESLISADTIDRDPYLVPADAVSDVGMSGFESEVHPISNAWTTSNLHAGQFSAACGVFAPGWVADSDSQWLLVCEPTGSLVQRQRLRSLDGIWRSERESDATEWLASQDDWFRPVDLVADVDDGVLVIDMCRAVIEHPDWAPVELKKRPDTYHGDDMGRIWQVNRSGNEVASLSITDDDDAIEALGRDDPLPRMLASAYWFDRYDAESLPQDASIDELIKIVTSSQSLAASQARAAYILNRWGRLSSQGVASLSTNENPRLRCLAVRLTANNLPGQKLVSSPEILIRSLDDESLIVRRAALESLLVSRTILDSVDQLLEPLRKLAVRDGEDQWTQKLLTTLPVEMASTLLWDALRSPHSSRPAISLLQGWMLRITANDSGKSTRELSQWMNTLSFDPAREEADRLPAMRLAATWQNGLGKTGRTNFVRDLGSDEAIQAIALIDSLANNLIIDEHVPVSIRLEALEWVAQSDVFSKQVRSLTDSRQDATIRSAAYRILIRRDAQWTKKKIVDHGDTMTTSDRIAIVGAVRGNMNDANWLLTQIAEGQLPKTFVDPSSMDWFRNHPDAATARLGRETFAPAGEVAEVLNLYSPAVLNLDRADVVRGKELFAQHCGNCHRIDGAGYVVGPDVSDSRDKTPESLLTAILDPSGAIDASFNAYQALTVDGEVVTGLLADENSESVTLNLPGGQTRRFERDDLELFRPASSSLMPAGLQRTIDVDQMRDLIAYLKRWRYTN